MLRPEILPPAEIYMPHLVHDGMIFETERKSEAFLCPGRDLTQWRLASRRLEISEILKASERILKLVKLHPPTRLGRANNPPPLFWL